MPINRDIIAKLDLRAPWFWLATWGGCGLMLPGPGTWGTLGALPFCVAALVLGGWPALLAFVIGVTLAGLWAADKFERAAETHDVPAIVIDEVAGIGLTLLAGRANAVSVLLGFVLFRFFDIVKPWPVSWCDRKLPGAFGVMADDLVAGMLAGLCLWGLRHAGFG